MLELSWDGFIEHTQQGWNVGKPPYGYLAEKFPHPVPARRAEGRTKHRLVPDPERGPVVTEIFRLRALERLGYRDIAQRLNADPVKYPPPVANRAEVTVGRWTVQSVRGILENPKYTGYQVWNRKARKKRGKGANPVSEWTWSAQPVHEPLVTREIFNAVWSTTRARQGSRSGAEPNPHSETLRTYLLRSYVYCMLCERRMFGKASKGLSYYVCYKDDTRRSTADWAAQHPKALWIREKILTSAVHWFFRERVFGPNRHRYLRAQLAAQHPSASASARNGGPDAAQIQQRIQEIERRQERLLDQLAEEDGGDPEASRRFRRGIRERYDRLDQERRTLLAQAQQAAAPSCGPSLAVGTELLNALPQLTPRFAELPEAVQREIYDAFRLEVRYHRPRREIHLQVTVSAATATDLARLTTQALVPGTGNATLDQPCFVRPRQDSNLRPSA
ncbi:recombinase family protein [Streptomyces sp. NPDC007063]|uniref:recombinase family protein n=1 Tax=Streptomyces sp. NPDC007063 TaxID=3364772 RepID=UPI00368986DD